MAARKLSWAIMPGMDAHMRCVLCGAGFVRQVTVNRSFGVNIVQCKACGFVQTEPVSRKALSHYYATYYRGAPTPEQIAAGRPKSHQQALSQVAFLEEILGSLHYTAALDYGTGDGELPALLRTFTQTVYAVEEDPRYLALLEKERWLHLITEQDLRAGGLSQQLELVTVSHVLEHLSDPGEYLQLFATLLKPGGYLLVDVPNEIDMLKRGFQAMGHLHYFSADSLRWLAERDGLFDLVHMRHCNRSVQAFIDSGFTLPENYALPSTPDGTTIRALLCNRNHGRRPSEVRPIGQPADKLFEEYSARIVEYYHRLQAASTTRKT